MWAVAGPERAAVRYPCTMSAAADPSRATPPTRPGGAPFLDAEGRHPHRAPKQWTKNVLVFAAPAAAGVLDQRDALLQTLVAFVGFCLAASGTYFLNDANDAEADRLHPTKRLAPDRGRRPRRAHRAGDRGRADPRCRSPSPRRSTTSSSRGVVAGYVLVTLSYTLWLKYEPVIDLAAVAAGFVFRAIAGGVATNVPLSDWFLIVAGAGSLFIVTGKRHAEQVELGSDSLEHRRTLGEYSDRVPRLRARGRRRA